MALRAGPCNRQRRRRRRVLRTLEVTRTYLRMGLRVSSNPSEKSQYRASPKAGQGSRTGGGSAHRPALKVRASERVVNDATGGLINCPMCGLAHRSRAVTCDSCGQALHVRPDFEAMRAEYGRRKRDIVLALGVMVGMIVLNLAVVRWVGGF